MKPRLTVSALILAGLAAGCVSDAQYLQQLEPKAIETAVNRGRFELNCPAATGTILSKDMLQPALQGGFYVRGGAERAEYTVGVAGCGERATYLVICPLDQSGCWTAGARNIIRQQ